MKACVHILIMMNIKMSENNKRYLVQKNQKLIFVIFQLMLHSALLCGPMVVGQQYTRMQVTFNDSIDGAIYFHFQIFIQYSKCYLPQD